MGTVSFLKISRIFAISTVGVLLSASFAIAQAETLEEWADRLIAESRQRQQEHVQAAAKTAAEIAEITGEAGGMYVYDSQGKLIIGHLAWGYSETGGYYFGGALSGNNYGWAELPAGGSVVDELEPAPAGGEEESPPPPPPPPPPPNVDLSGVPQEIARGADATLSWTVSGADYCIAECASPAGGCVGWVPPAAAPSATGDTRKVSPPATTVYRITCFAGTVSASDETTITVTRIRWREIIPRLFPFMQQVFGFNRQQ